MARLPYPNFRSQNTSPKHHTLNVLKLLSYSSATVEHWANVGNAQFNSLALSKRDRELVILLSTAKFKSSYEWTHHILISRKAGVTNAQRSEIEEAGKQERYFQDGWFNADAGFSDKDKALLSFVEATIEQPEVSDELWADVRNFFVGEGDCGDYFFAGK